MDFYIIFDEVFFLVFVELIEVGKDDYWRKVVCYIFFVWRILYVVGWVGVQLFENDGWYFGCVVFSFEEQGNYGKSNGIGEFVVEYEEFYEIFDGEQGKEYFKLMSQSKYLDKMMNFVLVFFEQFGRVDIGLELIFFFERYLQFDRIGNMVLVVKYCYGVMEDVRVILDVLVQL